MEESHSRRTGVVECLVDQHSNGVGHVEARVSIEVSGDEESMPAAAEDLRGRIVAEVPGIETPDARASDDLDICQVGVRSLKRALEAAFEAGRTSEDR